ncbi:hypothetical protein DPMN_073008 [Dreissena polymorpha]|uniref:Uncharacterized protein n=1 Tax=Dreissena polymorpha TaxID=45954 RepID=A0A9D4BYC6_DREPO|nr:hypothetical protein DPMN_073008 [Dreissena polymorpha]
MTFIHSSRYVQLVQILSYPVASPSLSRSNRVNFYIVPVGIPFPVRPSPSLASSKRDDRKTILSRLKVLKHLSRSTPFQAVHKARRQFVTRCYYDHSVPTQFEPFLKEADVLFNLCYEAFKHVNKQLEEEESVLRGLEEEESVLRGLEKEESVLRGQEEEESVLRGAFKHVNKQLEEEEDEALSDVEEVEASAAKRSLKQLLAHVRK